MKAIGGYFELELNNGEEYHQNAIRLNTGRNAFEYILRANKYRKVFLPYYTCDVMLEPVNKLNLQVEFYHIDNTFRPVFDFSQIRAQDIFVYNNYFGICDKQVSEVVKKCKNLIIDNSQAFFSKPFPGVHTFYSPRKFFGIPDGAYLYTNKKLEIKLEQDISFKRCVHLLGRIDLNEKKFYPTYKKNDDGLIGQPIKIMSNLTTRILNGIDYNHAAKRRRENFIFLNKELGNNNQLKVNIENDDIPMIYPYLTNNGNELKKKLIKNNIYIATYWPSIIKYCDPNSMEYSLTRNLVTLSIDQRYNIDDMNQTIKLIC